MKLSIYNYIQRLDEENTLVWNTYSGAIATFKNKEFNELIDQSGDSYLSNESIYSKNGFLVNDDFDEVQDIIDNRKKLCENYNSIAYRILTTTGCNARCAYCYEQVEKVSTMSKETAKKVLEYIFKELEGKEQLAITWFGGEPLVNYPIIDFMNEEIRKFIKDKNIKYTNKMVSNASLFNEELIDKAKNVWKLDSVQITFDGTRNIHNAIKNYSNVKDGFTTTLNNIKRLVEIGVPVLIRLNYGKDNYKDLQELIRYLGKDLAGKVKIYAHPIFSINGNDNSNVIDRDLLGKCHYEIYKTLKDSGFRKKIIDFPPHKTNPCGSVLPSFKVIMPDGTLMKCTTEIRYKDHVIGNVEAGLDKENELNKKWIDYHLDDECKNCVFLPICQGGCRAQKLCTSDMFKCCITKYVQEYLIAHAYKEDLL